MTVEVPVVWVLLISEVSFMRFFFDEKKLQNHHDSMMVYTKSILSVRILRLST